MRALIRLLFLLLPTLAWAQSSLPQCPEAGPRNDCFGEFSFLGGYKYIGEFRNDRYEGHGFLTMPSGTRYRGGFSNNEFNGRGIIIFPDGTQYVGNFKDGYRSGVGIEYARTGAVLRAGIWGSGGFFESRALDARDFPYESVEKLSDLSRPLSSSGNVPIGSQASNFANPSINTPSSSELLRLAAEAESERKKRQQAEEQLAKEREQLAREREQIAASGISNQRPPQPVINRNERRIALVIGNSTYKVSPLENPANDAADIADALTKAGFKTTLVRNATLGQMRDATRRFADQLPSSDVALIYFAGHGIESNRKNYMIPVNADLKFEYELSDQAYDAGVWLEMLESIKSGNADRVNIVILDACRNNTLIGARNLGRGLGKMDAPAGTFLAYSTAPGKVAADGSKGDRNSPFTKHLLRAMQQPGLPIEEVFKEVRRNVSRDTNGAQVPWESTSLTGFFAFRQIR